MSATAALRTSRMLRWRWLPALVAALAGVSVASAWLAVQDARHHNLEVAAEGARNLFRMVTLTRQWNAEHGGVYVPVGARTRPNPYLDHPSRDIVDQRGRALTLMNPAFMTREIAELAERIGHVNLHITSLKPIRPANAPDDWEKAALERFERGEKEYASIEPLASGEWLRYMAPLAVTRPCLACHEKQGYRLGDVRGGISVSLDYAPTRRAFRADVTRIVLTHLLFFFSSAAVATLLVEVLRRRWMALDETIDTLERTRDELVSSEKMASLGRLVAGFAHEINTPMGVAVGAVSHGESAVGELEALLGREEVDEAELRAPLVAIRESQRLALANLRRGAELVTRFKRTSIDQGSGEKRQYLLAEAIQDVLATLQNTLKRLPVTVRVDCPPGLSLYGTPGLVEQVVTNLVTNSIAHAFDGGNRGGHIHIEATTPSPHALRIVFSDDGAGIDPAVLTTLFEPFVTTRRHAGGSGLGLFIVYNIVTRDLGGTIHCESRPGEGARFVIDLPVTARPPGPARGTSPPPPGGTP